MTLMADRQLSNSDQARIWDHFQNEGVSVFLNSLPRLKYIVKQVNPGLKLLNIGVGGAMLEMLALEKGIDTYSLDPDSRAIEKLRANCNLGEKARVGWSTDIPFEGDLFDIVVMSEVLEHLDERQLGESVKQVMRVLKQSGRFIVTVPFKETLDDNWVVCPHCQAQFHRWGHQQTFTLNRLRSLCESEGFAIERMEVRCFPDWSRQGISNTLKSCLRYILGRFGVSLAQPNIFLKAIKK